MSKKEPYPDGNVEEALTYVMEPAGDKVGAMELCYIETGDRDVDRDLKKSQKMMSIVEDWLQSKVKDKQ